MSKKNRILQSVLLAAGIGVLQPGLAASQKVSGIPNSWQIESYGEKGVTLWYTPSTCANGQITLPPTATVADHNRLYATIMSAKISQVPIFIFYDDTTPGCQIVSFGFLAT